MSSAMIPSTTSRTCYYTIRRGHCQHRLCQPRVNLAIMGVEVSLILFYILNVKTAKDNLLTYTLLFIYLFI
jgi:hypothetical protein